MRNKSGKYLNKTKARLPRSAYLSYLLAVTLVLSGVSMAKYSSSASGTATARVAKFQVSASKESSQSDSLIINCDNSETEAVYSFTVSNDSEVSVDYTVKVTFSQVPSGFDVKLKKDGEVIEASTITNGVYSWKDSYAASESDDRVYSLVITADEDIDEDIDTTITSIKVDFEQKD